MTMTNDAKCNAERGLTDATGRVRADGVEVAQRDDAPGLLAGGRLEVLAALEVLEDLLDHVLRATVSISDTEPRWGILTNGHWGRTVDGSRGREDDGLAAILVHQVQKVDGAVQVVRVVQQGLAHALSDGF